VPAALVALAFVWFWQSRPEDAPPSGATPAVTADASRSVLPNSVVVLPFSDVSPDPSKSWIVTGLHIDIISKLGQLGLNVINREAVLKYLETKASSHAEIAADFRVQSILVGTIRYTDDEIRVEAQLVDPATGFNSWNGGPFESGLLEMFEAEAAIATNVATHLNAEFSVAEQRRIETRPTVSLDAWQSYFQAFSALEGIDRSTALRLLEEATQRDPKFAAAHAQLALVRAQSAIDWATSPVGTFAPEALEEQVREAAAKALDLDPRSATAHAALGELNMYFWRWTEAEEQYARAYELNPNDADVLLSYAQFKTFRGEYDAALPMAERLVALNPTLPDLNATGAGSLYSVWEAHVYAGNTDKAIEHLELHLELHPRQIPARINLGFMEVRRENDAAAEEAFDRVAELTAGRRSATIAANLAYGYSRIGRRGEAERLVQEIESVSGTVSDATSALAHLAIGDRARSLERLDRAIEMIRRHELDAGWFNLMMFKHNLTGDPDLEQPDFKARRAKIAGT
jgi:TolB-like protein/Flp pilus assembly protein TadD